MYEVEDKPKNKYQNQVDPHFYSNYSTKSTAINICTCWAKNIN